MKHDLKKITNFLFETGILSKTPRSGFFFLGSGEQSVAEHINRVGYVGFALASMANDVDVAKVLEMCLFHDITETRISDANYVHQKYLERDEEKAINDLESDFPFGGKIKEILTEYKKRETKEAKLVKDADNIELLLSLKEQVDIGNERAKTWIPPLFERLITDEAKQLAEIIIKTDSDNWWFNNKKDDWWVNRKK
jgi:putative hydrolase of HD superfamily